MNNCLTCKWKPEWCDGLIPMGVCRWSMPVPIPKGYVLINNITILKRWVINGEYNNCPAWEKK